MNWVWGLGQVMPFSSSSQYCWLNTVWDPISICWMVLTQYPVVVVVVSVAWLSWLVVFVAMVGLCHCFCFFLPQDWCCWCCFGCDMFFCFFLQQICLCFCWFCGVVVFLAAVWLFLFFLFSICVFLVALLFFVAATLCFPPTGFPPHSAGIVVFPAAALVLFFIIIVEALSFLPQVFLVLLCWFGWFGCCCFCCCTGVVLSLLPWHCWWCCGTVYSPGLAFLPCHWGEQ